MGYNAFISYSHAADGRLAPALQHAFHRFAKPLFKLRALKVFRDKENLSANPALWPAIEKALGESEHFLLLASPESARSEWVGREVQWWIANRPMTRQLIVLTGGEIVWDAAKRDFDWDRTTALPRLVTGRFSDEPLWVDLRWAKTADDLSLRHSQFRAAVLDLVAPLHGKPKEELDSEDVRQYRKTRRLARSAVAGLTGLTITASLLAVYAVRQRNEAVQQRDRALSRQAGAQALRILDANLDTALLLAVEASRRADTFEARNALLSTLVRAPHLVSFLSGHRAAVTATAFSPDGKVLVSGSSDDGALMFWDAERREGLGAPVIGHPRGVTGLAFSPDGRVLASAGQDGTVQLWEVTARRPLGPPLAGHIDSVTRIVFSPDGRMLATGDAGGSIRVWDVAARQASGAPLRDRPGVVTALAFDAGGSALASGDGSGRVTVWDLRTAERAGTAFFEGRFFVRSLAFSPNGHAVASGMSGGNLIRWDVGQSPPRAHPVSSDKAPRVTALDERAATVNASGTSIAVAVPGVEVLVAEIGAARDREPLTAKASLKDLRPRSGILTVALSPDGRSVASGYRDGTLAVWDVTERHILSRPLRGHHAREVTAVTFAPQGVTLVSGSLDGTLILWDTTTREPLGPPLEGHAGGVASVAFGPGGTSMASGGYEGTVLLWDVAGRRAVGEPLVAHRGQRVSRVVFSPDGKLLAAAGGGRNLLWDVTTRQPLSLPLDGRHASVTSAAFSPDGRTLASGGHDGTIMLWDVGTRQPLGAPMVAHGRQPVNHLAFAPDGKTIASAGHDARLAIWSVTESRSLAPALVLDPIDREHMQSVGGPVVFTPDGRTLISGGNNRFAVWDVASRQPLESILHIWGEVATTRVAIGPDGRTLAASSGNGVALWDVGLSTWQRRACQLANRDLTGDEWKKFVGPELPYRRTCAELPAAR